MFPHEKALVKRLSSKPFALLGINTDDDLKLVKAQNKKQNITWRSWYDGSTGGPICQQYKVRSFPTIYVLDHKGIIRYKGVREKAMDKAVDELLKGVEKKSASILDVPSDTVAAGPGGAREQQSARKDEDEVGGE